jgi:antirestriction protein ArdC
LDRAPHPSRLTRDLAGRFGTDAHAAEELVTEFGAPRMGPEARREQHSNPAIPVGAICTH